MIAAPSPEDEYGRPVFKDPLPYLHHFNEELKEEGHEPLFLEHLNPEDPIGYDVMRPIDFRDWDEATGTHPREVEASAAVPESRIRVVGERNGELVHECYEKVIIPIESTSFADTIRQANAPLPYKWRITYRVHSWDNCTCPNAKLEFLSYESKNISKHDLFHPDCGRFRQNKVSGSMGEHVASLNLGMADENYNGYYPTVPGNDVAHHNEGGRGMDAFRGGEVLYGSPELDQNNRIIEKSHEIRGGTEIRGGRAEHRKKTKDLILWDKGTQAHVDRLKKEKADKIKAQSRKRIEERFKQMPPSWTDL